MSFCITYVFVTQSTLGYHFSLVCNYVDLTIFLPAETKFWPRLYFHKGVSVHREGSGYPSMPCRSVPGGSSIFRGRGCLVPGGLQFFGGCLQFFGGVWSWGVSNFLGEVWYGGVWSLGGLQFFEIQSTFGWYASYWNAFLYYMKSCVTETV